MIPSNGYPFTKPFTLLPQDLLKKLKAPSRNMVAALPASMVGMQHRFAEGSLVLDKDLIDLTMIPPPMTPDEVHTRDHP